MYKIKMSRQALGDLRSIYEYYAFTLGLLDVAKKIILSLQKDISKLNRFPFRFKKYQLKKFTVHLMTIKNYSIVYLPDSKNKIVTILRVFHGSQDIEDALKHL